MRRLAIVAAALFASAVPVFAQEQYSFAVEGTGLTGSAYQGTATIQYISDSTCIIEWTTGPQTSQGICMRNGSSFAAAYTIDGAVGLVVYQIMEDGILDGIWTIAGMDGAGTEVLTPQ